MGYEAEMHNIRVAIAINNHDINMVMDSLHSFFLHVTTEATGPYHCPSHEKYAPYVAWLAGFGDNVNADQGGV